MGGGDCTGDGGEETRGVGLGCVGVLGCCIIGAVRDGLGIGEGEVCGVGELGVDFGLGAGEACGVGVLGVGLGVGGCK